MYLLQDTAYCKSDIDCPKDNICDKSGKCYMSKYTDRHSSYINDDDDGMRMMMWNENERMKSGNKNSVVRYIKRPSGISDINKCLTSNMISSVDETFRS